MHDCVDDPLRTRRPYCIEARPSRSGSLRAPTRMFRTTNFTASVIWEGRGPVISCASNWPDARSLPR